MGVGALTVIALAYVLYSNSSSSPDPSKKKSKKSSKEAKTKSPKAEESLTPPENKPTATTAPSEPVNDAAAATVEDVDEEDDEEEEKKLRKTYDHTLKRAKQFLQGEKYANAAALFSEAIDLASRIPSASKDILALYNNRSAMFEKDEEFENSLKDIVVVLTMDGKHLKARTRRARIYEKQERFEDALRDLVFCSIVEGASGVPQSSGPKVAELCKKVSIGEVGAIVERIRGSSSRPLPNKGYCRNFFESFMSYHEWKREMKDTDRDELVKRSYHELGSSSAAEEASLQLNDIMALIKLDLVNQEFGKAFAHIPRAEAVLASEHLSAVESGDVLTIRAMLADLQAIECHLRCNLSGAMEHYLTALKTISYGNMPALLSTSVGVTSGCTASTGQSSEEAQVLAVEIVLRLASAYIELGDKAKV